MICKIAVSPQFCTTSCPYSHCLEDDHNEYPRRRRAPKVRKGHSRTRLHWAYIARSQKIAADWDSGLRNKSELARAYGVVRSTVREAVRRYSTQAES